MNTNTLCAGLLTALLILTSGCGKSDSNQKPTENLNTQETLEKVVDKDVSSTPETNKNLAGFLPEGHILFEEVYGDLNKDGLEDCVIISKGTDQDNIIIDEYRGELDRNRRGIIILFNEGDHYRLAVQNNDCFSSENEDGGVYFPPELSVYIEKGNLYIHYGHGRYGYWKYTFRHKDSDFELIGYDSSSNFGPVVQSQISINFLTKKKLERTNTNPDADSGEEVFDEAWSNIEVERLIRLSEIVDFDDFFFY